MLLISLTLFGCWANCHWLCVCVFVSKHDDMIHRHGKRTQSPLYYMGTTTLRAPNVRNRDFV